MIETYFQQGTLLTGYNFKDVKGTPLSEVSVGIVDASVRATHMKVVSILCGLATSTKTTRSVVNFRFLPYAQGAINYCESMGCNVISAYFSGCIMARYKVGGVWRVCHVSTGGPNDCKVQWDEIKGRATDVTEFKPHELVRNDKILGLIATDGSRFAIGCAAVDLHVKETRNAQQILREEGAGFRQELKPEEKLEMAKQMAKSSRILKALVVRDCKAP
jgi:hypothetical protein